MKLGDACDYGTERIAVSDLDASTYISTENMLPNKEGITFSAGLPGASLTSAFSTSDVLVSNIRPYFKKGQDNISALKVCHNAQNEAPKQVFQTFQNF